MRSHTKANSFVESWHPWLLFFTPLRSNGIFVQESHLPYLHTSQIKFLAIHANSCLTLATNLFASLDCLWFSSTQFSIAFCLVLWSSSFSLTIFFHNFQPFNASCCSCLSQISVPFHIHWKWEMPGYSQFFRSRWSISLYYSPLHHLDSCLPAYSMLKLVSRSLHRIILQWLVLHLQSLL